MSDRRQVLRVILEPDGERWVYKVFRRIPDELEGFSWKPSRGGVAELRTDAIESACVGVRRALEREPQE